MIRLSKDTVREINKYTLQEEDTADGVPRVGLYILQARFVPRSTRDLCRG